MKDVLGSCAALEIVVEGGILHNSPDLLGNLHPVFLALVFCATVHLHEENRVGDAQGIVELTAGVVGHLRSLKKIGVRAVIILSNLLLRIWRISVKQRIYKGAVI